ncbi:uncharacterized protein RAG0_00316 [Rhynchosporium agropyri]|uniref:Uncharacterized protein n=2 Tax=Rhynchosporium TaxID=38037 RepID=A0A1E1LZD6_RHYSE|nr:uncharacterized protein RAG0_00316 [Rhynchosporium agropyri]CZT42224.1 uncharacterized protein RSE6_02079 [Rhynchosporium secalis]
MGIEKVNTINVRIKRTSRSAPPEIIEVGGLCKKILESSRHEKATSFTFDFSINVPLYVSGFNRRIGSVGRENY